MSTMTREQALTEARRRWGSKAYADWFTEEGDPPITWFEVGYFTYPGMGTERIHKMGYGATPESAFADADRRQGGTEG